MTPVVLAVDIGSSSLKAALVSYGGSLFGFERVPYATDGATRAADWERAFQKALVPLLPRLPADGLHIAAISISGNGPTLVAVDRAGTELSVLHWHNRRANDWRRPSSPSLFLPHLALFKAEQPDLGERATSFISCQEWLSWRLGAEQVTVLPSPAYGPFFWDGTSLAEYGIDGSKLPPFAALGSPIGQVSFEAALRTGLSRGIPIVASGTDFFMALLGSAVIEPGLASDRAGSSEGINRCADHPAPGGELLSLPHWRPGLWTVDAILPASGKLFEDYRARSGQLGRSYAEILSAIHQADTDERSGARTSVDPRALEGLRLLETLGFMAKRGVDTLARNGFPVGGLRLSGGQAKSPIWNQLKADILGLRLEVPRIIDTELAGNTAISLTLLGEASDLADAVRRVVSIGTSFEPDSARHESYTERYREWLSL